MFSWSSKHKENSQGFNTVQTVARLSASDNVAEIHTTFRAELDESIKPRIDKRVNQVLNLPAENETLKRLSSLYKTNAQTILESKSSMTDDEWESIKSKEAQLDNLYQTILTSLNIELSNQLVKHQASSLIAQYIFKQKAKIYLMMDSHVFDMAVLAEKKVLQDWNLRLTEEARKYFTLIDAQSIEENRNNLCRVFNCKKTVVKNKYLLEYPEKRHVIFRSTFTQPVLEAIDCLEGYLLNNTSTYSGRYNNIQTASFFRSLFSWNRSQKLTATLEFCDLIISNTRGDSSLEKRGALSQGVLSSVIDLFTPGLNVFFDEIKRINSDHIIKDSSNHNLKLDVCMLENKLSGFTRRAVLDYWGRLLQVNKELNDNINTFYMNASEYQKGSLKYSDSVIHYIDKYWVKNQSIEDSINNSSVLSDVENGAQKIIDDNAAFEIDKTRELFRSYLNVLNEVCIYHIFSETGYFVIKHNEIKAILYQQELLYLHFCTVFHCAPNVDILDALSALSSHIMNCYLKRLTHRQLCKEIEIRMAQYCITELITTHTISAAVWDFYKSDSLSDSHIRCASLELLLRGLNVYRDESNHNQTVKRVNA